MKTALALLAVLLVGPRPVAAKVSEIVKSPGEFDGKSVAVKGAVEGFRANTSQGGHDYTSFDLVDGKARLPVFLANKLEKPPKDGDKVTVVGRFVKARPSDMAFVDQIDASAKIDKAFGIKK